MKKTFNTDEQERGTADHRGVPSLRIISFFGASFLSIILHDEQRGRSNVESFRPSAQKSSIQLSLPASLPPHTSFSVSSVSSCLIRYRTCCSYCDFRGIVQLKNNVLCLHLPNTFSKLRVRLVLILRIYLQITKLRMVYAIGTELSKNNDKNH